MRFLLWILLTAPASATPDEAMPGLVHRLEVATAQRVSADTYFAGDIALPEAWPELDGAPMGSAAFLQGRLQVIQSGEQARAVERIAPPPDGLSEDAMAQWNTQRTAALDAEDAAATGERRLLLALLSGLEVAPGLRTEAIEAVLVDRPVLPEPFNVDNPEHAAIAEAAAEAGAQEAALLRYQDAAWRALTIPDDPTLAALVAADLEDPRAEDRLSRVQPLLLAELSEAVEAVMVSVPVVVPQPPPDIGPSDELQTEHDRLQGGVAELITLTAQQDAQQAANLAAEEAPPAVRAERLRDATVAQIQWVDHLRSRLTALQDTLQEPSDTALAQQDVLALLLHDARSEQRHLRGLLSSHDRHEVDEETSHDLLLSAIDEARETPALLSARHRSRQDRAQWRLDNLTRTLIDFLLQSTELILILLGWQLLRRRGEGWLSESIRLLRHADPAPGLSRLVPPAVDALIAWLLFRSLEDAPALGGLALIWLVHSVLVLLPRLVDHLSPLGVREPIRRSVRVLAWWGGLVVLASFTAQDILVADRLTDFIMGAGRVLGVVVIGRELYRWSPYTHQRINELTDREGREPRGILPRIIQTFIELLFLGVYSSFYLIFQVFTEQGQLGQLGSLLAQGTIKEDRNDLPPLTPAQRTTLHRALLDSDLHHNALSRIVQVRERWQTGQGDMIALIGDRGAGKSRLMKRLADEEATLLKITEPLHDPEDARIWLGEALGLPSSDWDGLQARLNSAPPRMILIDDAHRLLLRTQGGYTALRQTLAMMQCTADRHLWVVAFHQPTWTFLEGCAVPVNLQAFRCRVRLDPLSPQPLAAWLMAQSSAAGFTVRFDNLLPNTMKLESAAQRAGIQAAFWRRLTDISGGNPLASTQHWLDSLCRSQDPEVLDVSLRAMSTPEALDTLIDDDLFTLTAVILHEAITPQALSDVLSIALADTLTTCRHLEGCGILTRDGAAYTVSPVWRLPVMRVLRQKHMLHQE